MNAPHRRDRGLARARPVRRPDRDDRLRLDRQGHAAADRAPLRIRHARSSSSSIRTTATASLLDERGIRFIHQARDQGELSRAAHAAADRRAAAAASASTSRSTPPRSTSWSCAASSTRFYIDTVVEPWPGFYFDRKPSSSERARTTRCARRVLDAAPARSPAASTAVSCCGANPGMVSWFVKQALLDIAARPRARRRRAADARGLGPPDAARSASRASTSPSATPSARAIPKPHGRVRQHLVGRRLPLGRHAAGRARLGHAREVDAAERRARHDFGCDAAIYLDAARRQHARALVDARRRRPQYGFLVTHNESISIADYFTRARGRQGGLPADLPLRLSPVRRRRAVAARDVRRGRQARRQSWHILDENEIVDGIDELGVLLYGHAKNAYWYGSQLSIEETRRARALPERDRPAGDLGGARRHGLGAGESRTPASSRPTRWISAAASRCSGPISAR